MIKIGQKVEVTNEHSYLFEGTKGLIGTVSQQTSSDVYIVELNNKDYSNLPELTKKHYDKYNGLQLFYWEFKEAKEPKTNYYKSNWK